MDEEGLRIDIAEALGKATAAICLQAAIVAMFVNKRLMTIEDAAELTGLASLTLQEMSDLPDDAKLLAESALRGFAASYTKRIRQN
jgi:hypothetical protein